ncbi:MAG TPA: uroporphyrinogen-III synthase [Flavisolibacter sp.]|jgi:uroporphyrinogen-III synthase|nr:uroporphyrinogen-III synthase [Flavisolibacter sp.]
MATYKVLSTKKLAPSLVEKANENGIEIIEQEAIAIKPIVTEEKAREIMPWVLSEDLHYAVFTSANAVLAVQKYLRQGASWLIPNWKVFAIGGKTKETLYPYFNPANIVATADYGKDLAQKIIEEKVKEVVFFCGNRRRDELPNILKAAGITVHEIVVYETTETPAMLTEDIDGILFFSPSAVHSFFSANQLKKGTVCFAIGQTTADSIADFTDNRIIISESPSQESMLASVNFYFQNINCYE